MHMERSAKAFSLVENHVLLVPLCNLGQPYCEHRKQFYLASLTVSLTEKYFFLHPGPSVLALLYDGCVPSAW